MTQTVPHSFSCLTAHAFGRVTANSLNDLLQQQKAAVYYFLTFLNTVPNKQYFLDLIKYNIIY